MFTHCTDKMPNVRQRELSHIQIALRHRRREGGRKKRGRETRRWINEVSHAPFEDHRSGLQLRFSEIQNHQFFLVSHLTQHYLWVIFKKQILRKLLNTRSLFYSLQKCVPNIVFIVFSKKKKPLTFTLSIQSQGCQGLKLRYMVGSKEQVS